MKKLFWSALFVSVVFSLVAVPSYGQAEQSKRWVCLQVEHCWKDPNSCAPSSKGNGHKSRLAAKPGFEPLPGVNTYVVECVSTDNDQICTTGNAAADTELYGKSTLAELQSKLGYRFEGMFKADGTTAMANPALWAGPYEWGDSTPASHNRRWYAMNYYDPTLAATGGEGGQQQGTFDFETAEKDCVSIAWDPYGRVFDPQSLEPIAGAKVTLYVKKGSDWKEVTAADVPGGAIINNQVTLEDGQFSFVVPDGDYKLVTNPPAVADIAQVDPNYAKAYSDIYPALTGEVIQQRGAIQHRDIPVVASSSSTPKMMEYFYETNSSGVITLQGRVSHPLSRIIAGSAKESTANPGTKTPYRTIGVFYADKFGNFKIQLDQNTFEKTDEYIEVFSDIEIQKVDLRDNTQVRRNGSNVLNWLADYLLGIWDKATVQAQAKTTTIKFEPIPQYLEGYAYDSANKPIPNARVGVYLTYSNKPYSETTADVNGYFRFTAEYLPSTSYIIKYTNSSGATVTASTSKFLGQNQKYMAKNKINPFVAKDLNNVSAKIPTPSGAKLTGIPAAGATGAAGVSGGKGGRTGSSYAGTGAKAAASAPAQSTANPLVLVFLLLIVLLVGVGAGLVLYMKNKQPAAPQW